MTTTLRTAFLDALAYEPPFTGDALRAASAGRRIRHRRRLAGAGALGAVLTVAVAATVTLVDRAPSPVSRDEVAVAPFAPVGAPPASQPQTSDAEPVTAEQQRIATAIREASPPGWTFEFGADRWSSLPGRGGDSLESTADDGAGPGRLMVGMSPVPGSQQLRPCRDDEFRSTSQTCVERLLPDGSVLSLRGLVNWEGIETIYVVVTHPDGSGVGIESGNFTLTWPLPRIVAGEEKKNLTHLSRPHPTYTVDQLTEVVLAVDRVVHG